MYPTSDEYKKRIKALDRLFKLQIEIKHKDGVLVLTDENIVQGSFKHTSASQPSEDFTIGGIVASTIDFGIINDVAYDNIRFEGAIISPKIGVCLKPPGGIHYKHYELGDYTHYELGEHTHSQLMGEPPEITDNDFEYVPLGKFTVDEVNRLYTTITIKAVDDMFKLDRPYSESQLTYPSTLGNIFTDICSHCQVLQGTTTFTNMDYVVKERPVDDNVTFRTVLGWVAELAGSFATFDRTGRLRLKWYEPTGMEYTGMNRFDFKPSDNRVQITGITYTDEDDQTYMAGDNLYSIDLSDNALVQGDYDILLPNILDKVGNIVFYPFKSNWQGDPAIEPGDMITQISELGKEYPTLVTRSVFKYRGKSELNGQGLPTKTKGLKGSSDQKIAQVNRRTNKRIEKEVTALEQAQEQATQLLTEKLGGYVLKRENELLIMDNINPDKAMKVWRWNLNGLGYSKNGIDGPYELAMTMDGQIVADFITTGELLASLIKIGGSGQPGILNVRDENDDILITLDKEGIKLSNGATMIGGSGVISVLSFISAGEYAGYQLVGMVGNDFRYEVIERAHIPIFIPDRFKVERATLYLSFIPTYQLYRDQPLGFFHGKNLKLYKSYDIEDMCIYLPFQSEWDMDIGLANKIDITNDVFGINKISPTGDKAQIYSGDITDHLQVGTRMFLTLETTDDLTDSYHHMGGAKFEIYVEGYKS